jgi:hypothetical protein
MPLPIPEPYEASQYLMGLDLGQAQDYSALVILEKSKGEEVSYSVRHLERFPLGTPYPKIVQEIKSMHQQPLLEKSRLVIDQTGVGRAVVDLFREVVVRSKLIPINITAGNHPHPAESGPGWNVPKKELVGTLQVLLQEQRLKIAAALPETKTLIQELSNFQVKITASANETFGAWREGTHDDLVLALACAAWVGERVPIRKLGVW